jgi:hypothetical protein
VEKSNMNILHTLFIIRESVTYLYMYICIYLFHIIICISLNNGTGNGKLIGQDVEGRMVRPTPRSCPNICLEQA